MAYTTYERGKETPATRGSKDLGCTPSIPEVIHLHILRGSTNPLGMVLGALLLYQEGDKVVWWSGWSGWIGWSQLS
jgi:hypothetical protein